jgi:hypothetical protein
LILDLLDVAAEDGLVLFGGHVFLSSFPSHLLFGAVASPWCQGNNLVASCRRSIHQRRGRGFLRSSRV